MLVYEEPVPIDRATAEAEFASGDVGRTCRALVAVAFHEPDGAWVEGWCLRFLAHRKPDVRRLAATCLGHVARIHGRLADGRVMAALQAGLGDSEIAGEVEEALADIHQYVGRS